MNVSLLNYEPTIRSRIRSGEFANVSEYIRHCIRVAELVEARSGPRGASFATRQELERLLDDGMGSPGAPVTAARKRAIYQRARA
jgi:Arc/MetJ-type ribon-helix-helix transcriptional regulator